MYTMKDKLTERQKMLLKAYTSADEVILFYLKEKYEAKGTNPKEIAFGHKTSEEILKNIAAQTCEIEYEKEFIRIIKKIDSTKETSALPDIYIIFNLHNEVLCRVYVSSLENNFGKSFYIEDESIKKIVCEPEENFASVIKVYNAYKEAVSILKNVYSDIKEYIDKLLDDRNWEEIFRLHKKIDRNS